MEMLDYLKDKLGEGSTSEKSLVLYGSETGNAQSVAQTLHTDLKRRGVRATLSAMDDYDFEKLPKETNVYMIVATAGQGDLPENCTLFFKELMDKDLPSDYLSNVKFATFGLGDSSYVYYNKSAIEFDDRFSELGA